jgi:hypothetical protein
MIEFHIIFQMLVIMPLIVYRACTTALPAQQAALKEITEYPQGSHICCSMRVHAIKQIQAIKKSPNRACKFS